MHYHVNISKAMYTTAAILQNRSIPIGRDHKFATYVYGKIIVINLLKMHQ